MDVVWDGGLLKKGVGLCHGISGNGYALLRIGQVTRGGDCLGMIIAYCEWLRSLGDDALQEFIERADAPYSLFEGCGGMVMFLQDVFAAMHNQSPLGFPGFDDLKF